MTSNVRYDVRDYVRYYVRDYVRDYVRILKTVINVIKLLIHFYIALTASIIVVNLSHGDTCTETLLPKAGSSERVANAQAAIKFMQEKQNRGDTCGNVQEGGLDW